MPWTIELSNQCYEQIVALLAFGEGATRDLFNEVTKSAEFVPDAEERLAYQLGAEALCSRKAPSLKVVGGNGNERG